MAFNTLIIESRHTGDDVANLIRPHSSDISATIESAARYVHGYALGTWRGELALRTGAVKATATLTITSTGPADTQTFTLCGTTFTAKTTPAGTNHFQRSDTPATVAAAIAAIINASPTAKVTGAVSATSLLGVVTVLADDASSMGNGIQIDVGTLANTALSSGGFSGGSNGTETLLTAGGAS